MSYNNESSVAGSSRSLNRNISSPTSNTDDPTFWVPGGAAGPSTSHCSDVHSGIFTTIFDIRKFVYLKTIFKDYSEEPQSPNSPTSSNRSFALSVNSIPIARSDKHVILTTTSPARPKPKVASMQAKLDHTKIDTSLYQQVRIPFFTYHSLFLDTREN